MTERGSPATVWADANSGLQQPVLAVDQLGEEEISKAAVDQHTRVGDRAGLRDLFVDVDVVEALRRRQLDLTGYAGVDVQKFAVDEDFHRSRRELQELQRVVLGRVVDNQVAAGDGRGRGAGGRRQRIDGADAGADLDRSVGGRTRELQDHRDVVARARQDGD